MLNVFNGIFDESLYYPIVIKEYYFNTIFKDSSKIYTIKDFSFLEDKVIVHTKTINNVSEGVLLIDIVKELDLEKMKKIKESDVYIEAEGVLVKELNLVNMYRQITIELNESNEDLLKFDLKETQIKKSSSC